MIMLSGCPCVTFSHGRKKLGSSSNVITCEYLMPSTSTERERKAFFCSNYLAVIPYSPSNSIAWFCSSENAAVYFEICNNTDF